MAGIIDDIIAFRDARNWKQYHNPKDLAISLSLEASELLENFQWRTSEEGLADNLDNIKDELADVAIYALMLAHDLGLDIEQVIRAKLAKNDRKYPVEKAFNNKAKYTEL